jgi:putative transferase (TIGR04331 family)
VIGEKINFLVSNCRELWLKDAKQHFAIDSFIVHVLEREGQLKKYHNIEVAPPRRTTREELQADHDYVDQKFQKYTEILVARLDKIHRVNYGSQFWKKALSMGFLRHVSMCYDFYQACEENLDVEQHDFQLLSESSFYVPNSFDEHRHFLQHTHFSQEQLFSIYCDLFLREQYTKVSIEYSESFRDSVGESSFVVRLLNKLKARGLLYKVLFKMAKRASSYRSPVIAVLESYFSAKNFTKIIIKSAGLIQAIKLPSVEFIDDKVDLDARLYLAKYNSGFDNFDRFVFATMQHLIPKSFVENFNSIYNIYLSHVSGYPQLKSIVCESWIGSEAESIALAVAKQNGINHIYNEHNYLSYPFLGNVLKYQIPLVDEFLTLGWSSSLYPNLIASGSLFEWQEEGYYAHKEHDIVFIIAISEARIPVICADYGENGAYGVQSTMKFDCDFLDALGDDILSQVYVRSYPNKKAKNWLTWDYRFLLSKYLSRVKHYDDYSLSGKLLMKKSRLVVVAYQSTSHLESLVANIPTIFFWNKEIMHFEKEHENIYDGLIKCGICQIDPIKAANFVNKIKDNPEQWWFSKETQEARDLFLKKNIGQPDQLLNYLLSKK